MKWFVPGRLEVFGKHTDYAGGRSLLAAVDRGITVSVADGDETGLAAETGALPGAVHLVAKTDPRLPAGHWARYVQTVLDRLTLNFGELRPARLRIDSDLPLASGMSSSSALVTGVALALADHNDLRQTAAWRDSIKDDLDLAAYVATIENGLQFKGLAGANGVGTFGGSEDHAAMLGCGEGCLTEFSFCPIARGHSVPFPSDWSFVVAVSGVLAEKTGAALELYNGVSLRARQLVARWNDRVGDDKQSLAEVLRSAPDALDLLRRWTADSPQLTDRLEAFVTESDMLIPLAISALRSGNLVGFGQAANLSHRNADQLLRNQVPQTNDLQRLAVDLGALGASGFGAGFGGSVWAMVRTADAADFGDEWVQRYLAIYPELAATASAMITRPGPAARCVG